MHGMTSPVIVVPGITGSDLQDEYELPPEPVWTALKRRFEDITLHPGDRRYELREPARVVAGGPLPQVYEELIKALRDELSGDEDKPVPVFPFGYDWRMALKLTEKQLAAFVVEVIDRTRLIPHYRDGGYCEHPTVSLVGHSMGGLIIAGYLARYSGKCVDKVITLGAPFGGSYEAVVKIVTGTSTFWIADSATRERKTARLTPSLYHLIPRFGGLDADGVGKTDLFCPESWQSSVKRSIGSRVSGWRVAGCEILGDMLKEAKEHRDRICRLKLSDPGEQGSPGAEFGKRNWLAIVGVDAETRVGLRIVGDGKERRFDLRSMERRNCWTSENGAARYDTGDGVVPLSGAIPPFLDRCQVVCVTPDDFGYWELDDRAFSRLVHFHASLPSMNMVHRLIVRFLLGRPDHYCNTWGRRLPGVKKWKPPLCLREKDKPCE